MKNYKIQNIICAGILLITVAACSSNVNASTAKVKVRSVTRYNKTETTTAANNSNTTESKAVENQPPVKTIQTDNGVYHLSQNSKYRPYIWKNADGSTPDYVAYVFEPEVFNGHTVFVDAGHGDNSAPETSQKREKYYPVEDSKLSGMNTSMVGSKANGYGVEARNTRSVYDNAEIEPQFTLRVALLLKDKLLARGYRVVMSRTDFNQNLSNGARSALAGETSDIMISIHSNAGRSSGTLTFYPGDKDYISGETYPGYTGIMGLTQENIDASKRLAESMAKNITSSTGLKNKGAHTAVLRIFSYSTIPTCLVEAGFADNITDAKILATKKDAIAAAMAQSIDQYFGR